MRNFNTFYANLGIPPLSTQTTIPFDEFAYRRIIGVNIGFGKTAIDVDELERCKMRYIVTIKQFDFLCNDNLKFEAWEHLLFVLIETGNAYNVDVLV